MRTSSLSFALPVAAATWLVASVCAAQPAPSRGEAPPPAAPRADAAPEQPSLLSQLPIGSYIMTAVAGAVGTVSTIVANGAEEDLKDPREHATPDETQALVTRARVGRVVEGVVFGITGIIGIYGTYATIRTVMKRGETPKTARVGNTCSRPLRGTLRADIAVAGAPGGGSVVLVGGF